MYFVYGIYNHGAKKLYIGQTKDLLQRIRMHNDHTFVCFTSRFQGEWKLIYKESVTTRSEALRREKQLKSFRGREFVRSFIPG
jgi:putative endonuclease